MHTTAQPPTAEPLAGRRVAVFGGSSGIGLCVAKLAVALGAETSVISRTQARLEAARIELGDVEVASLDVRDAFAVRSYFEARSPFDHVVVTAAELRAAPLRGQPLDQARQAMDSKFWGAVNVAYAARVRPQGSLTLVSGMVGQRPKGAATMLSAINAALDALSQALALELAPVRVNCISPGRIDTAWWDFLGEEGRRDLMNQTAARLPVRRAGKPEHVAQQIAQFMLNDFVTGSLVQVDGGDHLT
jgi:NAD(P)-dependent dehydrogenase (short-subunit alcohol dehydrogenase family)